MLGMTGAVMSGSYFLIHFPCFLFHEKKGGGGLVVQSLLSIYLLQPSSTPGSDFTCPKL